MPDLASTPTDPFAEPGLELQLGALSFSNRHVWGTLGLFAACLRFRIGPGTDALARPPLGLPHTSPWCRERRQKALYSDNSRRSRNGDFPPSVRSRDRSMGPRRGRKRTGRPFLTRFSPGRLVKTEIQTTSLKISQIPKFHIVTLLPPSSLRLAAHWQMPCLHPPRSESDPRIRRRGRSGGIWLRRISSRASPIRWVQCLPSWLGTQCGPAALGPVGWSRACPGET